MLLFITACLCHPCLFTLEICLSGNSPMTAARLTTKANLRTIWALWEEGVALEHEVVTMMDDAVRMDRDEEVQLGGRQCGGHVVVECSDTKFAARFDSREFHVFVADSVKQRDDHFVRRVKVGMRFRILTYLMPSSRQRRRCCV